jgi:hypothetical protein
VPASLRAPAFGGYILKLVAGAGFRHYLLPFRDSAASHPSKPGD